MLGNSLSLGAGPVTLNFMNTLITLNITNAGAQSRLWVQLRVSDFVYWSDGATHISENVI